MPKQNPTLLARETRVTPVLYLSPDVELYDLNSREQTLVALLRGLDEQWQLSLLTSARNQVDMYRQTKAIEALSEAVREYC